MNGKGHEVVSKSESNVLEGLDNGPWDNKTSDVDSIFTR